jgi:polysaccharide deacetylase family sporulation protein PdaB
MKKRKKRAGITATAIALGLCIFSCIAVPMYAVNNRLKAESVSAQKKLLPIYCVETSEKKLAISFDCAWGVEHTDELLDIMQKHGVKCTFFAVQFWVERYPEYAKKITEAGHELGTHSRTHSYMSKLSQAEIQDELKTSCDAIERATGKTPTLFRAPYGDYDDLLIQTASSMQLHTIQWDVDSLDWKNLSATEIALRIINGAKNGSIILCHNNGLHTAKALPMIFSTLQNKGFTFVPIGELIYSPARSAATQREHTQTRQSTNGVKNSQCAKAQILRQ